VTLNENPASDHARHDRLLVVRFLENDDELRPAELEQARRLMAACPDCAALAADLKLITDSTISMALPSRPRDFRITAEQAASLQPGGLRRFLRRPAMAFRLELLRPLAGAAVAIGLLLVVAGSLPMTPTAAPAAQNVAVSPTQPSDKAAPTDESPTRVQPSPFGAAATAAPADSGAGQNQASPASQELFPEPSQNIAMVQGTGRDGTEVDATPGTLNSGGDAARYGDADRATDALSPLVVLGALLAAVGLMVVGLTYLARRVERTN
jgi:pyruvate/2-oxoglutarate dehydrogenase complex dihydrolipoamide acyltransferase (E2) component